MERLTNINNPKKNKFTKKKLFIIIAIIIIILIGILFLINRLIPIKHILFYRLFSWRRTIL